MKKIFKTPSRILSEELDKINNNDLKQIQENIHFIINNKGYVKKHFKRMQRLKKKEFRHE